VKITDYQHYDLVAECLKPAKKRELAVLAK
jgi:hypothetical protein